MKRPAALNAALLLPGLLLPGLLSSCAPNRGDAARPNVDVSIGDSGMAGSALSGGPLFENAVPAHTGLPYADSARAALATVQATLERSGLNAGSHELNYAVPTNVPTEAPTRIALNVWPDPAAAQAVLATYRTAGDLDPAHCRLDWGDRHAQQGNAAQDARHPLRHTYAQPGSYTATLHCGSGAAVAIASADVHTGQPDVLDFDWPAPLNQAYSSYRTYQEKGFTFTPSHGYALAVFAPAAYAEIYNTGTSPGLYTFSQNGELSMTTQDGTPFTLNSLDTRALYPDTVADYTITGVTRAGRVLQVRTHEVKNAASTVTFPSDWTDLKRVQFGNPGTGVRLILDNVHAVHQPN